MMSIVENSLTEIKEAYQKGECAILSRWQSIEIEEYLENIGYPYGSHSYLESWLEAEGIAIESEIDNGSTIVLKFA